MIQVTFLTNNGKVASAPENSNLLRVSLREQGGIPFKCGGGLCGTCKCRIEQGLEHTDAIKPKERKHLTEEQRRRWINLLADAADTVGLPDDPEFRSAFMGYVEWGSRLAKMNSNLGETCDPETEPMPAWGWGVPGGPYEPPETK